MTWAVRRLSIVATAVATLVAAGCAGGYDSPVLGYRVGATDQQLLVIVEMTRCENVDRSEVRESATEVRVSVFVNGADCGTALPQEREIPVQLEQPVGNRPVVGSTGSPIRLRS